MNILFKPCKACQAARTRRPFAHGVFSDPADAPRPPALDWPCTPEIDSVRYVPTLDDRSWAAAEFGALWSDRDARDAEMRRQAGAFVMEPAAAGLEPMGVNDDLAGLGLIPRALGAALARS